MKGITIWALLAALFAIFLSMLGFPWLAAAGMAVLAASAAFCVILAAGGERSLPDPDPAIEQAVRDVLADLDCDWCFPPLYGKRGPCTCRRKCLYAACAAADTATFAMLTDAEMKRRDLTEHYRAGGADGGEQP